MAKVYIAGPMTGLPEFNRPAFFAVADRLVSAGDVPLNPAILPNGLTMKVSVSTVTNIKITELERLDPVCVMVENFALGVGSITITNFGDAWNSSWRAMSGRTVEQFFIDCGNDYLIGSLAPQLESMIDDDNDANMEFVKKEIIRLRSEEEITMFKAREYWEEAKGSCDVKASCCDYGMGSCLISLFGDDPWYRKWPTVPNPKYVRLERICDAVRAAFIHLAEKEIKTNE